MKTAILLSGEPRDFDYIYNDLVAKLSINDCDIYAHTWFNSQSGLSNLPFHEEKGGAHYQSRLNVVSSGCYLDKIQPKLFLTEKYSESPPFLKFKSLEGIHCSITRMHAMFYSIQKTFELATSEDYDLYIRLRPDLYLNGKIDISKIFEIIQENPNLVFFPDLFINVGNYSGTWSPVGDYVPDFMWIGGPLMAKLMLKIYSDIDFHCGKHMDVNMFDKGSWPSYPEHYLMRILKLNNFIIGKLNVKSMLARQYKEFSLTGKISI